MKKIISSVLLFAILAVAALALVSCAPAKDPADAEAALKEAGYTVINATVDGVGSLSAYNDEGKAITIMYFENKDDAKEAYDEFKAEWDEIKNEEEYKDWEFDMSGTMVWSGHKDAVKAAR